MLYRSKAIQKNCAETPYVTRVADESIGFIECISQRLLSEKCTHPKQTSTHLGIQKMNYGKNQSIREQGYQIIYWNADWFDSKNGWQLSSTCN